MDNDFKILLSAIIDKSSLSDIQKQIAKERLEAKVDIDLSEFAKDQKALKSEFQRMGAEINKILGNSLKPKEAEKWARELYSTIISNAKKATREQEKLNKAQEKTRLAEQDKYYKRIIDNTKELYKLKEKLLTADKEDAKVIKSQISAANKRIGRAKDAISKKGLADFDKGHTVYENERVLKSEYEIKKARLERKQISEEQARVDKEVLEIKKKEAEYEQELREASKKRKQQELEAWMDKQSSDFYESEKNYQDERSKYKDEGKRQELEAIRLQQEEINKKTEEYTRLWDEAEQKLKDHLDQSRKIYDDLMGSAKEISSLESKLASIDPESQSNLYDTVSKQLDDAYQEYDKVLDKFWNIPENLNPFSIEELSEVQKIMDKTEKSIDQIRAKQADISNKKASAIVDKIDTGSYESEIASIQSKFEKWGLSISDVKKKMADLNATYSQLSKSNLSSSERIDAEKKYQKALEKTKNEISRLSKSAASLTDRKTLSNKIQVWLDKNTKASSAARKELSKYINILNSADDIGIPALQRIKQGFESIEIAERSAGRLGKSLTDTFKAGAEKFAEWGLASGAIMTFIQKAKDMVQDVYDIDTAMTNLYKVTDETAIRYDSFLTNACKNAKDLGRTVSSLVDQTANWSKLGYSLDEAEKLAEISSIYANVGEVDDDTAVSDMVTAMKAFKLEASDAIKIVDKLNILGNKYATSAGALGTGLSNAASSLALSGNSIDETLAMITAMTEITQDASESGNALKILSMRLRGMKGELEALGEESEGIESISKIQTQILNLTGGKVNIFDEFDPTKFKSTYEIMNDIASVWNDISQTDQAELLEIIAGKQRGNSISALLTNMSQANEALKDSMDSSNSAMEEQERWMESLEAKTAQFEAAFQSLSNTVIDSDLIKSFVDFGTEGVQALDNIISRIGGLIPLLGTITGIGLNKMLG